MSVRTAATSAHRRLGLLPLEERLESLLRRRQIRKLESFEASEITRLRCLHGVDGSGRAEVLVVIPTYDRPVLVQGAVRSALAQSDVDVRIVVVNDGAAPPELPSDPRLLVVSLSRNCGVVGSVRNIGLGLLDSEYVAFLDDDNEWDALHLGTALGVLRATGAGLAWSGMRILDPGGATRRIVQDQPDRARLRRYNTIDASCIVVRREPELCFSRLPRRRGGLRMEDWELVWRYGNAFGRERVPAVTVSYRDNPESYFSRRQT